MTVTAMHAALPDASLHALGDTQRAALSLQQLVTHYKNSPELLAQVATVIVQLQEDLKLIASDVDRFMLELIPAEDELTLSDGSKLQRYYEPKEIWDDTKVRTFLARVVRQHCFDPETGQILDTPEKAVEIVLNLMGKSKPKKQAMKAHGVNPDDFNTREWSGAKVRVVAAPPPQPKMSHPLGIIGSGGIPA